MSSNVDLGISSPLYVARRLACTVVRAGAEGFGVWWQRVANQNGAEMRITPTGACKGKIICTGLERDIGISSGVIPESKHCPPSTRFLFYDDELHCLLWR